VNPNRPARLNRAVLAVLGLVLLVLGVGGLLAGLGRAPAWLPVRADVPLLPADLAAPEWAPWAGAAVAVVVGLAALRWLVAQAVRVPAGGTWQLADDPRAGTIVLTTADAAAPLAAELAARSDVSSATARLVGDPSRPTLHVRVTAAPGASLVALRRHLDEEAVPRLAGALEVPALDTDVLLRITAR
jgi:hypothetical protein